MAAFSQPRFVYAFLLTLASLFPLIVVTNHLLLFIQAREGVVLPDPLLSILPPADCSIAIFTMLYFSLTGSFVLLLFHPHALLRVIQAAVLMYTARLLTLYSIPLDPPPGCIPLTDPFVQGLAYGGTIITKDLFFSGHTAMMLILILGTLHPDWKRILSILLVAIMGMLLWQHAHYTIDILGSLIIAPVTWKLITLLQRQWLGQ